MSPNRDLAIPGRLPALPGGKYPLQVTYRLVAVKLKFFLKVVQFLIRERFHLNQFCPGGIHCTDEFVQL